MPATAVLQQLLQPLCCCSDPVGGPRLNRREALAAAIAARDKSVEYLKGTKPEATPLKEEEPKAPVCAPCDHQDAIKKIRARYGQDPPHLATTVAGGKDLSV
jgi:hypothetical protein